MFGRKEKSVLQSKLTKLAIQIGYAGKCVIYYSFSRLIYTAVIVIFHFCFSLVLHIR